MRDAGGGTVDERCSSTLDHNPRTRRFRRGQRVVGDRGVLGAGAGQAADGDVVGGTAALGRAGDQRADLGRREIRRHEADIQRRAQLAEACRLRAAVGGEERGMREDRRVELVLVLGIGPHGSDMQAGLEPVLHQQGLS